MLTPFVDLQFTLAFGVHVDLVTHCNVILVFANRTDHANNFPCTLFRHMGDIVTG